MKKILAFMMLLSLVILAGCQKTTLSTATTSTSTTSTTNTSTSTTTTAMPVTTTSTTAAPDPSLILWYRFLGDSTTTVADYSGNGHDGTLNFAKRVTEPTGEGAVQFDGIDSYIQMPNGILQGITNITVAADVYIDPSNTNPYWIYTFGSTPDAGATAGSKYLGLLNDSGNVLRGTITLAQWSNEQNTASKTPVITGRWVELVYTLAGATSKLYVDGTLAAVNYGMTDNPSMIEPTIANYIGKPAYKNDNYFKGAIKDFRIYNRALTLTEIANLNTVSDQASVNADETLLTLGDTSAVTANLTLPHVGAYGSTITWSSSNTAYIANDGTVTQPAYADGNQTVQLTATITKGSAVVTKMFSVTVVAQYSDEEKLSMAAEDINIPNLDDIRGNITLPETGLYGVSIAWQSDKPDVINTVTVPATDNDNYAPIPGGVVTRGEQDTPVVLTATLSLDGKTLIKTFNALVKAAPAQMTMGAYLFAYFTGEYTANGEQLYFATSLDGLHFQDLNNGQPVLTSDVGTDGIRDPFIMRSAYGDSFYIVATDLKIYGNGNWGAAQTDGSKSIVIWDSTDLVNWSAPRLEQVAPENAGCTWAPEAIYDNKTGEYIVYWASKTSTDNYSKQRIYYSETRDFYHFTAPQLYLDDGFSAIDADITYFNGTYYRVIKNETNATIVLSKGSQLLNTTFTPIASATLSSFTGVEGPEIYQLIGQNEWILLMDDYGGSGYFPAMTTDLNGGVFTRIPNTEYQMPTGARHGSVIQITMDEYNALQAKWG